LAILSRALTISSVIGTGMFFVLVIRSPYILRNRFIS
jgi:hypothetical protein